MGTEETKKQKCPSARSFKYIAYVYFNFGGFNSWNVRNPPFLSFFLYSFFFYFTSFIFSPFLFELSRASIKSVLGYCVRSLCPSMHHNSTPLLKITYAHNKHRIQLSAVRETFSSFIFSHSFFVLISFNLLSIFRKVNKIQKRKEIRDVEMIAKHQYNPFLINKCLSY